MAENVFGIPMNIANRSTLENDAEHGELVYYLVLRCADAPRHTFPASLQRRNIITTCEQCRQTCWLDPNSYIIGSIIRCVQCRPVKSLNCTTAETLTEVNRLIREEGW